MERIHRRLGTAGQADDDGSFLSPSLDELNERWLAAAMPPLRGGAPVPEPDVLPESFDGPTPLLVAELQRVGMPVFAGVIAVQQGWPDHILLQIVRDAADPRDLGGQMYHASFVLQGHEDERGRASGKVKAGLLIAALDHHLRHGAVRAAWHGVEAEMLTDVEWDAVLEFVLTMPAEVQREALHLLMGDRDVDADQIPRLAALNLLLPHLSEAQTAVAFDDVVSLSDPGTRRLAVELMAPRLGPAQVVRALRALGGGNDAREQTWLLTEVAGSLEPADPHLRQVTDWSLDAFTALRFGKDVGIVTAITPPDQSTSDDSGSTPIADLPVDRMLAALRGMDDLNRADGLLSIAWETSGELPAELVAEALRLPVLNAAGRYSARSQVLATIARRLPEDTLAAAFAAAMELPHRIGIGDAQAWGWNWTYEYPRGAVLHALAPRLTGELAEAAFTACLELPWTAREEVLQLLAPQADGPLAAAMFDYSFEIHDEHMSVPDDTEIPYALEQSVITQPIHEFKIYREVHFAEMIAATAPQLDPARLRRAVEQAQSFTNVGPRAWLPAKLLPLLGEDDREPLLSFAVVSALEFIGADPSRLDLLAELLPFMRTEIERRQRPADEFLAEHFPGRPRGLLDRDEVESLTEEELARYRVVIEVDKYPAMRDRAAETDENVKREMLIDIVLSPFFAENMQQILSSALLNAPVGPRVDALDAMLDILEPGTHAIVVTATFQHVLATDVAPADHLSRLISLLPHLGQSTQDALVEHAARLPGLPADDQYASRFVDFTLKDFERRSANEHRFDELRHNLMARGMRRQLAQKNLDVLRSIRSPRIELLGALAPNLSEQGMATAVEAICALPDEVERANGIIALLPLAQNEPGLALRAALVRLSSPFARWWALFNSQDELDRPQSSEFARSTVDSFPEPREQAVFRLLLIGYAGDDRRAWVGRALTLAETLNLPDRLRLLAMIAWIANDPELAAEVARLVSALPDDAVHDWWVVVSGRGIDHSVLPGGQRNLVCLATSRRLRAAARRGRAELLRELATESTAITRLTTAGGIVEIARAVREICVDWHWPSGK
ncbi:hypothetical protein AB0C38_11540 [Amycolatopsis sp. NPDC048633]|uniref:hypothetical protein n=1 Tax=Amycolatopsis sp. NPDC048633 TaxID=3157095 RepID=UPI0033DAE981